MGLNLENSVVSSLPHARGDLKECDNVYQVSKELLAAQRFTQARNGAMLLSSEVSGMADFPDGDARKASVENILEARIQIYMLLADIDIAEYKSLSGRELDIRKRELQNSAQFYLETTQLCFEKMSEQYPQQLPESKSLFYLKLCTKFNAVGSMQSVREARATAIQYLREVA